MAKPGDIRFIDQNGDGMLDTNDRVKVGSGTPKVSLGFNINLTYKDFDLVANFYGDFGAKRYNYTKYQLERMDHVFNYGKNALNAWTPEILILIFHVPCLVTLIRTLVLPPVCGEW